MNRALAASILLTLTACPGPEADLEWKEAFSAESVGWLLSVWGPAGDDVWAVGGAPDEGALRRFDGSDWSAVELPAGTPLLNWVFGFSSSDVYVVGNEGTILHYDGTTFTAETSGSDQSLWGVWGASSDDVWAVGGNGRADGQLTLLRRQNGTWTRVDAPTLQRANVFAMFKVWGTSADNVYAVGQRGAVLHFDGTAWNEELVGASEDLIALWGTGPNHIAIVGGRNNAQIVTYDGVEWTHKSLAPLPGLNGVWMRDPNVVHVVGVTGTIATVDFDSLEYTEESPPNVLLDFHATFGASDGRIYAVGGNFLQPMGPYMGVAYGRDLAETE